MPHDESFASLLCDYSMAIACLLLIARTSVNSSYSFGRAQIFELYDPSEGHCNKGRWLQWQLLLLLLDELDYLSCSRK
jgi:hypothetical protein